MFIHFISNVNAMKIVKINSMIKVMLKLSIAFFFLCFGFMSASAQNGKVPELVNVQTAKKIVGEQFFIMRDEITNVELAGGSVEPTYKIKFELFKAVYEILQANTTGTTTFLAIANNCNYQLLKSDDEAYQDLVDGVWDENINELIKILTL
jgi:hypothetical protein